MVDEDGIYHKRYIYDAYGNVSTKAGWGDSLDTPVADLNPFLYNGYYYDTETGFYYCNSRYYDPENNRFVNVDSLLDTASLKGYNLFAYCGNDPVNKIDSSGHMATTATAACTIGSVATSVGKTLVVVAGVAVVAVVVVVVLVAVDETAKIVKTAVENAENIEKTCDQSVYVLKEKDTGKVRYVGRTNNPARREQEHKNDERHPERKNYKMTVVQTGLTIDQARAYEQIAISAYTIEYLDNARREISVGRLDAFASSIADIAQLFESVLEDEAKNLMGR